MFHSSILLFIPHHPATKRSLTINTSSYAHLTPASFLYFIFLRPSPFLFFNSFISVPSLYYRLLDPAIVVTRSLSRLPPSLKKVRFTLPALPSSLPPPSPSPFVSFPIYPRFFLLSFLFTSPYPNLKTLHGFLYRT